MSPHLTVLTPVRSFHPLYLERAIGSILGQTSPRWRLLVIDDGAEDRRAFDAIVGRARSDPRVDLVQSERPGIAGALNTGMRRAGTEFVGFLLGDDMWSRDAVEILTGYIERCPEVDFFHSSRRFIDARDRFLSSVRLARESFTLDDFVRASPVKHLLCFRREAALAIGGVDETLPPHGSDDWDFPWSMAEAGARFRATPECVYLFRDHRDAFRLTTHVPRSVQVRAMRTILRKHGVGFFRTERRIAAAKRTYLRQTLYRSALDRWWKTRRGFDPKSGWWESY